MLSNIDKEIIAQLRKNARISLTKIANKLNIPTSTVYDKVKQHEKTIIKKHTSLLDFSKLGFSTKTYIAIKLSDEPEKSGKSKNDSRKLLQEFLLQHSNVNSLYRINFGFDFLAECVFRNIMEAEEFIEQIEKNHQIAAINNFNVIQEIKKEEFSW